MLQHNGWLPSGIIGIVIGVVALTAAAIPTPAVRARSGIQDSMEGRLLGRFRRSRRAVRLLRARGASIRTINVSFREGKRGDGSFSLDQYETIFTDDDLWNASRGSATSSPSRLFIVGLFAIVFAVLAAASTQRFHGT
ncbi:MAG: hypothetical protein R2707_05355 [Acidimicrobiales bacterium]